MFGTKLCSISAVNTENVWKQRPYRIVAVKRDLSDAFSTLISIFKYSTVSEVPYTHWLLYIENQTICQHSCKTLNCQLQHLRMYCLYCGCIKHMYLVPFVETRGAKVLDGLHCRNTNSGSLTVSLFIYWCTFLCK